MGLTLPGFNVPQSVLSLILHMTSQYWLTDYNHTSTAILYWLIHRHTLATVAGSCKVYLYSGAVYLIRVSMCVSVFHSRTQLVVLCCLEHCVPLSINQDGKAVFHFDHPSSVCAQDKSKYQETDTFSIFSLFTARQKSDPLLLCPLVTCALNLC